jgi:hypothetical protein
MDLDPIFAGEGDLDAAREIVATVDDAELFLYPGDSITSPTVRCRPTTPRPLRF